MRLRIAVAVLLPLLAGGQDLQGTEFKGGEWLETITLYGELRLRHESFDKDSPGQTDRDRQRYRLRLGADFDLPLDLAVKLRLASGTGEQVSTSQTFNNLSSEKEVWVDRAYIEWTPRMFLRFAGGKLANPFWTVYASDAVWDEEFNPEGVSESLDLFSGRRLRVFANAIQMIADEDSNTTRNQWMFGEQMGMDLRLQAESRLKIAGAYYDWIHERVSDFDQELVLEGNRRDPVTGALLNDFGTAEVTAEFSTPIAKRLALILQGTYIKNTRSMLTPAADEGYQVGGKLGNSKEEGHWEVAFYYKHIETDATVADIADSDFGDGGTNRKGHIVWAGYNPRPWLLFRAKYFTTEVIDETLAPGPDDVNRLQLDLTLRF